MCWIYLRGCANDSLDDSMMHRARARYPTSARRGAEPAGEHDDRENRYGPAKMTVKGHEAASAAKHPFLARVGHPSGPEDSRPKQWQSRRRPRARLSSTTVLNPVSAINAATAPTRLHGPASNSAAMPNSGHLRPLRSGCALEY